MAIVISADEIKKQIPDYSPDKAEIFHRESAKLADKLFSEELKKTKYQILLLKCYSLLKLSLVIGRR